MPADWPQVWFHSERLAQRKKLACFVMESDPGVAEIVRGAGGRLASLGNGDRSFCAYLQGPERARIEARALYEHLQQSSPGAGGGPSYRLESPESRFARQRVRLAPEVLHQGCGNCLEWVLLFAACLRQAGLYPLVIVTGGHVIAGYWLSEEAALRQWRPLLTREALMPLLDGGIALVETTRIQPDEKGEYLSFEQAEADAQTHRPHIQYAVDLRAAREAGLEALYPAQPLPRPGGHHPRRR